MGIKPRQIVTPLLESISVQDAENVAKKVAEAVESQMQQLRTLQGFAVENQSLTKLLLELPDLVSYNIMVLRFFETLEDVTHITIHSRFVSRVCPMGHDS